MCPVKTFETYLLKLNPKCAALFQRPKKEPCDGPWYDNMCLGKHTHANKMKVLSKLANLSIEYTNHSIRATSVSILDQCGFEACVL